MAHRQAIVVAGAESRRGRDAVDHVPPLLRARGVDVADIQIGTTRREVCDAVKRAIDDGARLIAVCGGDGTQAAVVPYFVNSHATLAVVPAGTGNSFALGLGIAGTFEAASDAIAFGDERMIDAGCCNGAYFANFITIGLAAQVGEATPHALKKLFGPVAYGIASIVPMLTHEAFRADLRWENHRLRVHAHQIIVANGRFYGHEPLAPDASLDDGRLTVFVRDDTSRLDIVQTYLALIRGDQAALRGAHVFSTASELEIHTKKKAPVAADGDAAGTTPVCVRVVPKALRVMVPQRAAMSA